MSDDFESRLRRRFATAEETLCDERFSAGVNDAVRRIRSDYSWLRVAAVVTRESAAVFRRLVRIPHLAAALLGTLALAGWTLIG